MLAKWLDVDVDASWEKIKQSIQLAVEERAGMSLLQSISIYDANMAKYCSKISKINHKNFKGEIQNKAAV